jgi:superoxide dismutase
VQNAAGMQWLLLFASFLFILSMTPIHSYWESMKPAGGGAPVGPIAELITASFGSFEAFKDAFSTKAAKHFGSGWVFAVVGADGKLAIWEGHDAGCPVREGLLPLFTIDVWEVRDWRDGCVCRSAVDPLPLTM